MARIAERDNLGLGGNLAAAAIVGALVVLVAYTVHFLATLVPWYGWFGLAMGCLTTAACLEEALPRPRQRWRVISLPSRRRIEAMGGGRHVSAAERWAA